MICYGTLSGSISGPHPAPELLAQAASPCVHVLPASACSRLDSRGRNQRIQERKEENRDRNVGYLLLLMGGSFPDVFIFQCIWLKILVFVHIPNSDSCVVQPSRVPPPPETQISKTTKNMILEILSKWVLMKHCLFAINQRNHHQSRHPPDPCRIWVSTLNLRNGRPRLVPWAILFERVVLKRPVNHLYFWVWRKERRKEGWKGRHEEGETSFSTKPINNWKTPEISCPVRPYPGAYPDPICPHSIWILSESLPEPSRTASGTHPALYPAYAQVVVFFLVVAHFGGFVSIELNQMIGPHPHYLDEATS